MNLSKLALMGLMVVLALSNLGCPPATPPPTSSVKVLATVHNGPPDFSVLSGPASIFSGGNLTVPTGGYAGLHFSGARNTGTDLGYHFTDPDGNVYRRTVHVDTNGVVTMSAAKSDKGLEEVIVIIIIGIEGILSITQADNPIPILGLGSNGEFDLNVPMGYAVTQVDVIQHTNAGDLNFVLRPPANVDLDADNDGLPDAWEREFFGDPSNCIPGEDSDGDGLSNREEYLHGTNPRLADTDHDGLSDGDEIFRYHTDPLNWDTDGDGASDGDEVAAGTDPNDPHDYPVKVPDVIGMTQAQATTALLGAHLKVGTITTQAGVEPAGTVVATNPVAGKPARSQSRVNLFLSDGTGNQTTVNVPNLIGLTESQAEASLVNVGLIKGAVSRQSNAATPGTVISTNPSANTQAPIGGAVDLVLSDGPASNPSITITSPAAGMVYQLGSDATVKFLPVGPSADGPYTLIIRDAQLQTLTIDPVVLGTEASVVFHLSVRGTGFFTARLTNRFGHGFEDHIPYSVE